MDNERQPEKVEVAIEQTSFVDETLTFNGKRLYLITGDRSTEDGTITTMGLVLASTIDNAKDAYIRKTYGNWSLWELDAQPVIVGE